MGIFKPFIVNAISVMLGFKSITLLFIFSLFPFSHLTWIIFSMSDFPFTFHFHALKKEMATHSAILAWRIPGMGEPGGLLSMGSHRVGHNWSDLAVAAYININGGILQYAFLFPCCWILLLLLPLDMAHSHPFSSWWAFKWGSWSVFPCAQVGE